MSNDRVNSPSAAADCADTQDIQLQLEGLREALALATKRLMEQEKLAALGGFVAGFTHEINTPIGIAVTAASGMEEFARSLKRKLSGEKVSRVELLALADNLESGASLVNSNLDRAAGLISSFKMLAVDQGNEEESRLDLRDYLRQVITAHQPVLRGAQTKVELDAPEPLRVTLAAGLFSQIISNLIVNTLTHAFDEPVEASLEEEPPAQLQRQIDIALHAEGGQLHLHFGDNGRGVSPEVARRLFEPYFTTRRGRGGSGLGLHIVNSLCQRMGGSISIDPHHQPGLGFLIELPLRP
ncbi:ATP-binding protein [Paucibacter sp. AS339]|uniref:sensor histidine kinase n=1 Tax=Paucibacter hankyongi TaxID=3133434 RepID=UPI0030A1506A